MKKHFLLFVMAFMSMTAWAQIDISTFAIRVASGVYGGTAPVITVYDTEIGGGTKLDQGTDYTWNEMFYSDDACTTEAGEFDDLLPGGPYYVKVEGTGAYKGEKIGSCSITKGQIKGLVITIPNKTYGAVNPTPTVATGDVTGFKGLDTWASVFGDATITYTLESENVGEQKATFDALSTDLYEVDFPTTVKCKILAKPLTEEMVITPASGTSVYTAAVQTPSVVVKDGTKTLEAGAEKDYTVKTYEDAGLTTEKSALGVGTYYVGILGGTNYSGTDPIAAGSFEITKATLTVVAVNQDKDYNATATLPKTAYSATATETAMNIIGFLGEDKVADIDTQPTASVAGTPSADAGTYTITLSGGSDNNYAFNYVPGTFTIKKLPLTIAANNNSKLFGADDPVFTNGTDVFGYTMVGALEGEVATIKAWINHTSTDTERDTKANGDIKVTRSNATVNDKGVYEGVLVVSYNKTDDSVLRNYEVTATAGKFTISGGQIYITVLPQTIQYGDAEPNWANPELNKDYIITGLSGGDVLKKAPTLTRSTPTVKNRGTYAVTADGAEAPDGYQGITYVPSTLIIAAKELVVTPQVQTLKKGQTKAALDQNLYTISDDTKLAAGDKASEIIELKFNEGDDAPAVDTDGKLTATTTTTYIKGIEASVKGGVTNYTIKTPKTYGILIVVDPEATIVLNRASKDDYDDAQKNNAANVIAAAAADKYTADEAAAYNVNPVNLPTARQYGAVKTDAVYYANAEEYNAAHTSSLTDEEFTALPDDAKIKTSATYYADAAEYNTDKGTELTDEDFAALPDDAKIKTSATYYADATEYNTAHTTTVADDAAFEALPDAEKIKTPADYYTKAEVDAYNATLTGAVSTSTVQPKDVTFGDFTMLPEKWYPMVLPFETTVAEISATFGYAVVNVLNTENTDATKVSFKLHMGKIAANTPFCVKVYDVDVDDNKVNMNTCAFFGKTIIAPTDYAAVTTDDAKDKSGITFLGTYTGKTDGFRANEWYFSASADYNQYYPGNATNKTYLRPLGAWLHAETAGARIFEFEEADGTITAIQAIAVEGPAANAEGWYTIGGVKLQSAPTKKGIYINNGKKVVVK